MKLLVLIPLIVALIVLRRFKLNPLAWAIVWLVAPYVLIKYGFTTPVPQSVVMIYMGIVLLAVLAYISADSERLAGVVNPLVAFLVEKRYFAYLALAVIGLPMAVGASIYRNMTAGVEAPTFGRTVHPAPPAEITVHDTTMDMITLQNPYRELETSDPDLFAQHVANGREVYYKNCFYCHGDLMAGDGLFAYGLNPLPTNFMDPGTIAMFQESFLFWRIAQGAPGMPTEGGPWESAMPAWEKFLSEEEMWNVILFLYEFTDQRPRANVTHH